MDEQTVRSCIITSFPNLEINVIKKLGEGNGNVAYEINTDLIFRFPKKHENQRQLEQEISLQKIFKKYASIPFPDFIFIPSNHSFVGYKKLAGTPLLHKQNEFNEWASFSQQIGGFLSRLHTIPDEELNDLNLLKEQRSGEDWIRLGKTFFGKTKPSIPERFLVPINDFFNSDTPLNTGKLVLCHNDLGIEHILITEGNVTGIIDWSGAALTDPACDFARIYRDLGESQLDGILREYKTSIVSKEELRERAIFYGKCLLFEDLFYALNQDLYLNKCLSALNWMFYVEES